MKYLAIARSSMTSEEQRLAKCSGFVCSELHMWLLLYLVTTVYKMSRGKKTQKRGREQPQY